MTYDALNLIVGARLARVRRNLKLSQAEVCAKTGMKQTTLSTIESGHGGIRLVNLLVLGRIYGTTVSALLDRLEEETFLPEDAVEEAPVSDESAPPTVEDSTVVNEPETPPEEQPEWKPETS